MLKQILGFLLNFKITDANNIQMQLKKKGFITDQKTKCLLEFQCLAKGSRWVWWSIIPVLRTEVNLGSKRNKTTKREHFPIEKNY